MKKKTVIVIAVMVVAGIMGLAFSQSGIVNADPDYSKDDIRKQVTELYPGEITELEFEKQGNKAIYEVEVIVDNKEYELQIDGNTAEVIKLEEKSVSAQSRSDDSSKQPIPDDDESGDDRTTNSNGKEEDNHTSSDAAEKTVISEAEAEKIAKDNFSGKIEELELDEDDNRLVYEIEMVDGNRDADIEIDAITGEVLVLEIETDND
ncbi:PepSY domain-containing protein [Sediminibacillus massiliensis]|uniref:PepSY domain-containing protein n=1 Tax=Sediminibacillus massiliensis TaxID=1926277 RepID=UPI0009887173|nr:PepSY domain-containing protein [Sediminibacillus massiliensis]